MSNITKRELSSVVTDRLRKKGHRFTQLDVVAITEEWISAISDYLEDGSPVVMRRFGVFELRKLQAKIGRNPRKPGTDIPIPARTTVRFRPGKQLKARITSSHPADGSGD